MKRLLLILALLPLPVMAQTCMTATCTAAGVSETQVLAALPASGNTNATVVVNIPSGTSAWTTGFTYTVPSAVTNLTIQGNTTITFSGTAGTSSWTPTIADNTVIEDNYTGNNPLMVFNVGGSSTFVRFTGLTIEPASGIASGSSKYNGWIEILTGAAKMRFDHLHMNTTTYSTNYNQITTIRSFAPLTEAVADHNVFTFVSGQYDFGISDFDAYGDSIGNGDGTFAAATPWGSITGPFYVESNYLTGGGVINDCGNAGSMVIRYNAGYNATVFQQTHGTKSPAGPARGCRSIEVYQNYITNTGSTLSAGVGTKGTAAIFWGNTLAAGYYHLYEGGGDRQSGDECETAPSAGWGYCGTTAYCGSGPVSTGSAWDQNTNAGTGYACLDGVGRGKDTQALNGANFPSRLNSTTSTIAWSHQWLEPQYLAGNSIGSATEMLLTDLSVNNQDYYYDCGSGNSSCSGGFTGVAGTGYGVLASRPSTCTAGPGGASGTSPTGSYGVAYFATDANGGQGELYVCSATNTWTGIYEPYVYPHPLVGGGSSPVGVSISGNIQISGTVGVQ